MKGSARREGGGHGVGSLVQSGTGEERWMNAKEQLGRRRRRRLLLACTLLESPYRRPDEKLDNTWLTTLQDAATGRKNEREKNQDTRCMVES